MVVTCNNRFWPIAIAIWLCLKIGYPTSLMEHVDGWSSVCIMLAQFPSKIPTVGHLPVSDQPIFSKDAHEFRPWNFSGDHQNTHPEELCISGFVWKIIHENLRTYIGGLRSRPTLSNRVSTACFNASKSSRANRDIHWESDPPICVSAGMGMGENYWQSWMMLDGLHGFILKISYCWCPLAPGFEYFRISMQQQYTCTFYKWI